MTDNACSIASAEAHEPLAGSAVESVGRWILLEVTDTWAPKILKTEAFPDSVRQRLAEWSDSPRSRLQLVRRPGRSGRRPLFSVVSASGQASSLELDRVEDVLDLDLDTLPREPAAPMYLVCVHGRRDRCCAQHGSAVYRAIHSTGADVWQTSHLGGHRFAACVLSLPTGMMYGRLRAEHAEAFVDATRAGDVGDLEHFRGRCELDRPSQAAEIFLRRRIGEKSVNGIEWIETAPHGDQTWAAVFRSPSGQETVRVKLDDTGFTRPASCGGEPEPVTRFVEV